MCGLLWFDSDPKSSLEAKVTRAAAYYQKKYGQAPRWCLVHPGVLPVGQTCLMVGHLQVGGARSVLPHHFLLGVETSVHVFDLEVADAGSQR